MKAVFKSEPTLCSQLTKVKDPLPNEKLAGVVYQIPCQCGKAYVGEIIEDVSQRAQGCIHEEGYLEACHRGASMGSAPGMG